LSLRKDVFTYNHYKAVAKLPFDEQQQWLDEAAAGGWSAKRLLREISGEPSPARTGNDAFSRFERAIMPFSTRVLKIVKRANADEREQMVTWLHDLAKLIEEEDE
jgi:hypothetical protein